VDHRTGLQRRDEAEDIPAPSAPASFQVERLKDCVPLPDCTLPAPEGRRTCLSVCRKPPANIREHPCNPHHGPAVVSAFFDGPGAQTHRLTTYFSVVARGLVSPLDMVNVPSFAGDRRTPGLLFQSPIPPVEAMTRGPGLLAWSPTTTFPREQDEDYPKQELTQKAVGQPTNRTDASGFQHFGHGGTPGMSTNVRELVREEYNRSRSRMGSKN